VQPNAAIHCIHRQCKCPGRKERHRFGSPRAGTEDLGDLSGFVDQLTCVSRGNESMVVHLPDTILRGAF
jgi:hypothetical protein